MNVSSKVPAVFDGAPLIDYLASRFTYLSDTAWRELVKEGKVSCNGVICDGSNSVSRGDLVSCKLPAFEAPAVNLDYSVVFEDEWLLGVNKPAGLRVHSSGRFATANLTYHLRHQHSPPFPEVNPVNRLDSDTSGLVLLARTPEVLRQLMGQFAKGSVEKLYLAVVKGRPSPTSGIINLPIGPVEQAKLPRFKVDPVNGKPSTTCYHHIGDLPGGLSLIELRPATGRTHQLRVHLAAIDHPIAGDALYTLNDDDYLHWRCHPRQLDGMGRQALHCYQMDFFHPARRTRLTLTAPLAPDLVSLIGQTGSELLKQL